MIEESEFNFNPPPYRSIIINKRWKRRRIKQKVAAKNARNAVLSADAIQKSADCRSIPRLLGPTKGFVGCFESVLLCGGLPKKWGGGSPGGLALSIKQ